MAKGDADMGRIVVFESESDRGLFLAVTVATAIAFFAMVGFEDSVNMVEETKNPEKIFPRIMLTGLGIAVIFYVLVAISVIAVIPEGDIEAVVADEGKVLLDVVETGAPGLPIDKIFPFLTVIAVANTALHQHADGQPAALRAGQPGRAAAHARQGAARPADAVRRHRVLDRARARPDRRGDRSSPTPR